MIKEILEEIKFVNKNLSARVKLPMFDKVLWNNSLTHNMYDRIKNRVKLSENDFYKVIENGFEKIYPRLDKSGDYCLYFNKSEFIIIFSFRKETNSIMIVSILEYEMGTKRCIELNLNEIKEDLNLEIKENEFGFLSESIFYYDTKENKAYFTNYFEEERIFSLPL
jgi:hypothetical protein